MKNFNILPKDVQRILSSHKISENYSVQAVFHKKTVLENFAIFTGNHQEISFLIKVTAFRSTAFVKRDSYANVFLQILRKIWEHLF